MSSGDPLWRSKAVRGIILSAAGVLCLGAGAIVREHGDDITELKMEVKTGAAVQVERDARIISDLEKIKKRLGIDQ